MHILLINNVYETGLLTSDDLLARFHSLTGWAEALVEAGAQVSVLQRFHRQVSQERKGVHYEFIRDRYPPRLRAWQIPLRLHRMAGRITRQETAAVAHINGLIFPLTVLAGFAQALPAMPQAHLAMIYHTNELLPALQTWLAANPRLREAVTLVGQVPHDQIESYFHSADYFVLGSRSEGSGFALAEAMACGVTPIVTDIPSFRMMTDRGRVGMLWPVGDAHALATALCHAATQPAEPHKPRQFFEQVLSYPAIARRALAAYQAVSTRHLR